MPLVSHDVLLRGLSLPVIHIIADNLAQGWEEAVLATWNFGARIATQFDHEGDENSRDADHHHHSHQARAGGDVRNQQKIE